MLRSYFVEHLGLDTFYRRVIDGTAVRRLIEAAPGLAELLFIGQLWWLTTLSEAEAGLSFDRLVVDAPATGHAVSLLDLPAAMKTFGASGLLALEVGRVAKMMEDPAWTGAVVVSLAEALVAEETGELVPRVARDLRRPPLAVFVNRSARALCREDSSSAWVDALGPAVTPASRASLRLIHDELAARVRYEAELRQALAGATRDGVVSLHDSRGTPGPPKGGRPSPTRRPSPSCRRAWRGTWRRPDGRWCWCRRPRAWTKRRGWARSRRWGRACTRACRRWRPDTTRVVHGEAV